MSICLTIYLALSCLILLFLSAIITRNNDARHMKGGELVIFIFWRYVFLFMGLTGIILTVHQLTV